MSIFHLCHLIIRASAFLRAKKALKNSNELIIMAQAGATLMILGNKPEEQKKRIIHQIYLARK